MKKEPVNKFDLESAFKALSEIETPVVTGIKPNRVNLQERFTKKLVTDVLVEDYYDVNDSADLEKAQEEREAEIAKAKLARIEKIVDLDAESEEDLLPSYVGKIIVQCPQCMTLFYKNEEDIAYSEENPEVVNINELCQHCGNTSGYTVVGKVGTVGEDEAENYDVEDFDENELNLDFDTEESAEEETSSEETQVEEETAEEGNEEELELAPVEETEEEVASEETTEEDEEEKVEESLNETYYACAEIDGEERRFPFSSREEAKKYIDMIQKGEAKEFEGKTIGSTWTEGFEMDEEKEKPLTEAVDAELDAKLEAHNEYIEYLKEEIEKAEKALEGAKNDFVKKSIQSKLDALKVDLEAALPEALKDEVEVTEELPTPEEAEIEDATENKEEESKEETKESLTEGIFDSIKIKKLENEFKKAGYTIESDYTFKDLYSSVNLTAKRPNSLEELIEYIVDDAILFDNDKYEVHLDGKPLQIWNRSNSKPFDTQRLALKVEDINSEDSKSENKTDDIINEDRESQLKRSLSSTEVLIRELSKHDLFRNLSTRTLQRILMPYYIDVMGRDNLTLDGFVSFFEEEGFGTYVLDNYASLDLKQIKELTENDPIFVKALEKFAEKYGLIPEEGTYSGRYFDELFEATLGIVYGEEGEFETLGEIEKIYSDLIVNPMGESLTEASDDNLDKLLDSAEFKKPISEDEVDTIISKYSKVEEDVEPGAATVAEINDIVDSWAVVEDLDEESFNNKVTAYLNEVYSNVKSFAATSCNIEKNNLKVEGILSFNSGSSQPTTFTWNLKESKDNTVILEGYNEDLTTEKAFNLNGTISADKCLTIESLSYKYTVEDSLVEGLLN